jgi:hypothetical protein
VQSACFSPNAVHLALTSTHGLRVLQWPHLDTLLALIVCTRGQRARVQRTRSLPAFVWALVASEHLLGPK